MPPRLNMPPVVALRRWPRRELSDEEDEDERLRPNRPVRVVGEVVVVGERVVVLVVVAAVRLRPPKMEPERVAGATGSAVVVVVVLRDDPKRGM